MSAPKVTVLTGGVYPHEGGAVYIHVKDQAGAYIPTAQATITGFNYMGTDYALDVKLNRIPGTQVFSFTSNLYTTYYIRVEAAGYQTRTGSVDLPQDYIAEYTYTLTPAAEPPPPGEPGAAAFPWTLIPQAIAAAALILL